MQPTEEATLQTSNKTAETQQTPNQAPIQMMSPQMMGQQMLTPYPNPMMNSVFIKGQKFLYSTDPLMDLECSNQAVVCQSIDWMEVMTGYETENFYSVFLIDKNGVNKYAFSCEEQSGCCMRNCCPGNCRSFNITIKHRKQFGFQQVEALFAKFIRPFKCTCCCAARPEMLGTFTTGATFGKIIQPYSCCSPRFEVGDDKRIKYIVEISCCQCGYCCSNSCCGMLSETVGNIYSGDDEGLNIPKGTITKKVTFFKSLISDAGTWEINFPAAATPEDKLLLIGCAIMIGYRFTEKRGNDKKEK